jgi:hypothetical protein
LRTALYAILAEGVAEASILSVPEQFDRFVGGSGQPALWAYFRSTCFRDGRLIPAASRDDHDGLEQPPALLHLLFELVALRQLRSA